MLLINIGGTTPAGNVPSACAAYANRCGSSVVIEHRSRRVLQESNKDVPLEMASTTKVMTALVAIENLDLQKEIVIPKEAAGVEGSSIYLKEGERWTVEDLLYGLMLRSGNDAATALAIAAGGSLDRFVEMMNEKAASMGLKNTSFRNPHGLHADGHYTTAYELALITAAAMDNEQFRKIVATKVYEVKANDTHEAHYFGNKNKILSMYEGGNGVKTGYTTDSGRCLVSSAKRGGMQLISVVLNCPDMWNDSMAHMTQAFGSYAPAVLAQGGTPLYTLNAGEESVSVGISADAVYPVKRGEAMEFAFEFSVDKELRTPLAAGSVIGKLNIYGECLLFSADLITMNEINQRSTLFLLNNLAGELRVEENGKTQQIFGFMRDGVASRRGRIDPRGAGQR